MITMSMAGVLCEHVGWESVYYVHGAISVVIYALFFYFFRDSPRDQKLVISIFELAFVEFLINSNNEGIDRFWWNLENRS